MSAKMRGGVGLMCPNREPLVLGTETVLCLLLTPPPPADPEIKPKGRGQEGMFHLRLLYSSYYMFNYYGKLIVCHVNRALCHQASSPAPLNLKPPYKPQSRPTLTVNDKVRELFIHRLFHFLFQVYLIMRMLCM